MPGITPVGHWFPTEGAWRAVEAPSLVGPQWSTTVESLGMLTCARAHHASALHETWGNHVVVKFWKWVSFPQCKKWSWRRERSPRTACTKINAAKEIKGSGAAAISEDLVVGGILVNAFPRILVDGFRSARSGVRQILWEALTKKIFVEWIWVVVNPISPLFHAFRTPDDLLDIKVIGFQFAPENYHQNPLKMGLHNLTDFLKRLLFPTLAQFLRSFPQILCHRTWLAPAWAIARPSGARPRWPRCSCCRSSRNTPGATWPINLRSVSVAGWAWSPSKQVLGCEH